MADAREKRVLSQLIDTYSRNDYVFRNVNNVSNDVGFGDTIDLPYDTAPSVVAGGTRAAPAAANPSITLLTVDQFPTLRRLHPRIDEIQLLGSGNVVTQRAQLFTASLMAGADDYLLGLMDTASVAGGLTELNASGTVALSDFYEAEGQILDQDGFSEQNLMYAYHPLASPQIRGFFDPPREGTGMAMAGIPGLRTINGIPAIQTRSVPDIGVGNDEPAAFLFDRTKVFVAEQAMPDVRIVQDSESMGDVLQVGMIYGAAVQPGAVRAINCRA